MAHERTARQRAVCILTEMREAPQGFGNPHPLARQWALCLSSCPIVPPAMVRRPYRRDCGGMAHDAAQSRASAGPKNS